MAIDPPEPLLVALTRAYQVGASTDTIPDDLAPALSAALDIATTTERPASHELALAFAEAIGSSIGDEPDPITAIASLHAADLWLATLCAHGDRDAIVELDRVLASLRPTLARMGADASQIDELLQQLRARLLSGSSEVPPRIRGYRGRGELRSWLKVALVRDAVRSLRPDAQTPGGADDLDALMDPAGDPELAAMKAGYRDAFRNAFATALAGLEPRERNVLRYHLVEGLSIDEIGALHRVHRSTAARWLVGIREGLYDATRRALMHEFAVGSADIDSVLRMIRSRLDASIAGGLGPTP